MDDDEGGKDDDDDDDGSMPYVTLRAYRTDEWMDDDEVGKDDDHDYDDGDDDEHVRVGSMKIMGAEVSRA